MSFDLNTIGPAVISFLLGIGMVSTFLHKFLPATKKYITLSAQVTGFASAFIKAAEDDKVTEEEWQELKNKYIEFLATIKTK